MKLKKFALLLALILNIQLSFAQIYDPVAWNTEVERVSETDYHLKIIATVQDGWHLYSQQIPEGGPIPTTFNFGELDGFELVGNTHQPTGHTVDDPVFNMKITYFDGMVEFIQPIKVVSNKPLTINGEVEYMVCDDTNCLPPTIKDIIFNINGNEPIVDSSLQITEKADKVEVIEDSTAGSSTKKSLWRIFFIAFLSGFAALLTPCVFPMIPMTVSYFTKQSKTKAKGIKNAIIYGISIVVIYVLLGVGVTAIFGADAMNALSTNVWFNLFFFLLLVVFAISFLGAFELVLPSSWVNKVDKQADRGGLLGIFFMALALAIVTFSCTGPIVGTLLVEAASKGGLAPIIGMFGFSLAIALPFALFAMFPGWLNSLPQSGGWLNSVKVFLGFLELALAFKFLSNADLVLQTHLLERETYIAIWIGIFGTLAFYLFGKIQLPHDTPIKNLSVGRFLLGLTVLIFTIYMIPGLWGAPLKFISGFPPPLTYSESPNGVGYRSVGVVDSDSESLPEGAHIGPHGIIAFKDYEKGVAYAKKVNKPIMLDFTGHACINCRKMEDYVWSEERVQSVLKNEVVLISLYVDDKRKLPEEEQIISEITGKKIKYIGQKWSEFQTVNYKSNSQPYYIILDHDENRLNNPMYYNPDADEYLEWLRESIDKF